MGQAERLRVLAGESAWGIEAVHGVRAIVLMPHSVRGKNPAINQEQKAWPGGFLKTHWPRTAPPRVKGH